MENNKECLSEQEIDLFEYIAVVYKHRFAMPVIIFISCLIALTFYMRKPFQYASDATFFCLKNVQNIAPGSSDNMVTEDLVISILRSRMVIDKIITDFGLVKQESNKGMEEARKSFSNSTTISVEKGNIIKVVVITDSPELSMKIANAYLDAIDEFNRRLQLSVNASIIQILDRAVIPEKRLPRGTVRGILMTALGSFIAGFFIIIVFESIKKNNILERLKNQP
jgi:uncharacterized protein involved in exopolysaccharide biosynthesis